MYVSMESGLAAEGYLAPRWARAAIGAAAATLALAAVRVLVAPLMRAGSRAATGDVVVVFALLVPFAFGAAASVIADLDRGRPRYGLALLTGGALAVATMLCAAIWNLAVPAAAAGPILLRAIMSRPPAGWERLEYAATWTFAGSFWPVTIALLSMFLVRNNVNSEVVYAGAAAAFGATFTLALIDLDPERGPDTTTPPPP